MDSRIREIEQWVAEAKADLGECGREAYISKLFLLDAEIRAVIKETGILPAVASPRQQQPDRVRRRYAAPNLIVASLASVLLVTVSTVLFVMASGSAPTGPAIEPAVESTAHVPSDFAPLVTAGYIPRQIPGEEILADGWKPTASEWGAVPSTSAEARPQAAETPRPATVLAGEQPITATAQRGMHYPAGAPPQRANDATAVIALVPGVDAAASATPAGSESENTAVERASYVSGEVEHRVATSINEFGYFPEEGEEYPVNQTKEELGDRRDEPPAEIEVANQGYVDDVDNPEAVTESAVDNSEPVLDSSALAKRLEEKIEDHDKK